MRRLGGITDSMHMSLCKLWEIVKDSLACCSPWGSQRVGHDLVTEQQLTLMEHSYMSSEVAQSCPTLCNPMDCVAHQVPLSMEFSRQEYWSGLPFPSPSTCQVLG